MLRWRSGYAGSLLLQCAALHGKALTLHFQILQGLVYTNAFKLTVDILKEKPFDETIQGVSAAE